MLFLFMLPSEIIQGSERRNNKNKLLIIWLFLSKTSEILFKNILELNKIMKKY